jgi:hypothetical protein
MSVVNKSLRGPSRVRKGQYGILIFNRYHDFHGYLLTGCLRRFVSTRARPAAQRDIRKWIKSGLQKKPEVGVRRDRYTGGSNQLDK